jgi:hypothetical protein
MGGGCRSGWGGWQLSSQGFSFGGSVGRAMSTATKVSRGYRNHKIQTSNASWELLTHLHEIESIAKKFETTLFL